MNRSRQSAWAALALLLCGLLAVPSGRAQEPDAAPPPRLVDVTREAGITWTHVSGATPDKYLIETMGGGAGFLDYDGDGLLDIFLVNSGCHRFSGDCSGGRHALYRQSRDGAFTDVTRQAGLHQTAGYGMGVTVADFDNDGHPDIYITNFGPNILYRNNGDGTFTDVTARAGVAAGGWSAAAAFFDYNRDGFPDLFVGRYLEWDYDNNPYCGERRPGYRSYCHPDRFKPVGNLLFRNDGDGTFTDVTREAGLGEPGKALGVVTSDINGNGWPDIYVANDAARNFLFRNNGDGTFTEIGLLAEVAYGTTGKPESGMGVDAADVSGNGRPDLFVTNIDFEPNNLFLNQGDETFHDATVSARMGAVAHLYSGFGTRFVDYDNDGLLDIIVANGHPVDNVHLYREGVTGPERPFLLENRGGYFEEVGQERGEAFSMLLHGRGLAVGDHDNDGDPDFLLVQNGGPPLLLRNQGGNRNPWIGFELVGKASGRDAFGAVIILHAGGRRQMREKVGGASYLAAHDPRLLFGLGEAQAVDTVEIRWPSGATQTLKDLAVRRYHRIEEPASVQPLTQRPVPRPASSP